MQHSLGKREANSPLALAVVALVPLVALVCVRVIVTLGRMGAKMSQKRTKEEWQNQIQPAAASRGAWKSSPATGKGLRHSTEVAEPCCAGINPVRIDL